MLLAAIPLFQLLIHKQRGAAAKAQLTESINDELGLLAALLGTLFIVWGQPIADPIATIAVATLIAYNAVGLFRENASFLLGHAPSPEYLASVESQARSVPGVLGVHDLRAEYVGPDTVHAGMHIEVAPELSVAEAEGIAEAVRRRVHENSNAGYCVIQVDAAVREGGDSSGALTDTKSP